MSLQVTIEHIAPWLPNDGTGKLKVSNVGNATIENWSIQLITTNFQIIELWNTNIQLTGNILHGPTNVPMSHIKPGQEHVSDFYYNGSFPFVFYSNDPNVTTIGSHSSLSPVDNSSNGKVRFGYFSEWSIYQRDFNVDKIPVQNLSHICYAFMFANPSLSDHAKLKMCAPYPPQPYRPPPEEKEGTFVFHDEAAARKNIYELQQLKVRTPHIKIGISALGWTLSWNFSKIINNPTTRQTFVRTAVDKIIEWGFDFLDIDFEYPGKKGASYNFTHADDAKNLITTLHNLRAELDRRSPHKHIELTCAAGIDPLVLSSYRGAENILDYVLCMTYDVCGSTWAVGNHSPLYRREENVDCAKELTVDGCVKQLLEDGWSPSQICIGVPLYGRGWSRIEPYSPQLPIFGKSQGEVPASLSGDAGEPGLSSWRHMQLEFEKPEWTVYFDDIEKAQYAVHKHSGETWSYESPLSAVEKAKYVVEHGLAGVLYWELSDNVRPPKQGDIKFDIIEAVEQVFRSHNQIETVSPSPSPSPPPAPSPSPSPSPSPPQSPCKLEIVIKNTSNTNFTLLPTQTLTIKVDTTNNSKTKIETKTKTKTT